MSVVNYLHKCKTIFLIVLSIGLGINISLAFSPLNGGGDNDPKDIDNQVTTIVLDAGHGGKDPGASGSNSQEKDIVLELTLRLGEAIKKKYPDIKVIYTRKTDEFIELHERAHIANEARADLFISIHCNSAGSHRACGSETFVLGLHRNQDNLKVAKRENGVILMEKNHEKNYDGFDPNSEISHIILNMYQNAFLDRSVAFANSLETNLETRNNRKSRGVKQAGFLVLRNTFMPSILFEAGFLTNKEEEAFLKSDSGQDKIVKSFILALEDYKEQLEKDPQLAQVKTEKQELSTTTKSEITLVKHAPHQNSSIEKGSSMEEKSKDVAIEEDSKADVVVANKNKNIVKSPTALQTSIQEQNDNLEFCVQLAATPKKANLSAAKWRNIQNLSIRFENEMYKYQITGIEQYTEANTIKDRMRKKGFEGAFVVAYNNGNRMKISEAMGMSK